MNYITTMQAAEKWGITQNRVFRLITAGRIPDAVKMGKTWMIPENTEKPLDGRTKAGKSANEKNSDYFRFPSFEHKKISSFNPPLTEEELIIKNVRELFFACRFEEADKILGNFPETTVNIYNRITLLYTGCMIDIYICNTTRFIERYAKLRTELEKDFPHKKEMQFLLYEINASLGDTKYFVNNTSLQYNTDWDKSFLPHLASLCTISLFYSNNPEKNTVLIPYELNCILLENSECHIELQTQHIYLGMIYSVIGKKAEATSHFEKALKIAEKYELYYAPALDYYYVQDIFETVLNGFPDDFSMKIREISNNLHGKYIKFSNAVSINNIYKILSSKDFLYVFYAAEDYTNKEIAEMMNKTKSSVGMRFNAIYNKLGIKNKKELVQLISEL